MRREIRERSKEAIHAWIERIHRAAKNSTKDRDVQYHLEDLFEGSGLHYGGYAEPGYSHDGIIATANWNDKSEYKDGKFEVRDNTMPRVAALLERLGVELEWSDEWMECSDCNGLVRTSPNCYGWKRFYWEDNCEVICGNCVKKHPEEYLESLENNPKACMTFEVDMEAAGYKKAQGDFQSGMHRGMDADPKLVAKKLRSMGIERFIFELEEASQFYIEFGVWIHESEFGKFEQELSSEDVDGPSNADRLSLQLQEASLQMSNLQGDGVRVAKIGGDSVVVKLCSHEDFINGKALA